MDIWGKARTFAAEAAKKSQELTAEAAKRSQEFVGNSQRLNEIVSEASKRSKELAAEASKRADQIKLEAIKRADQIKSISLIDPSSLPLPLSSDPNKPRADDEPSQEELLKYGVTDDLKDFVKEINVSTFRDFPLPDDSPMTDVPTVSNVRQDLNEWQAKHATLVLSAVKEISKLRYELCPRVMKERKFWRIYFILVNTHVTPYEKRYMEDLKVKAEQVKEEKAKEAPESDTSKPDGAGTSKPPKTSKSSADQDLDVFLLGDLGDSDDGADDKDDEFDDDFDRIGDSSDDEKPKDSKQ